MLQHTVLIRFRLCEDLVVLVFILQWGSSTLVLSACVRNKKCIIVTISGQGELISYSEVLLKWTLHSFIEITMLKYKLNSAQVQYEELLHRNPIVYWVSVEFLK